MTKIIVLTGFFGSGKTTLIKHLIKTSKYKIGIIENDLAELNIDGKILNLSDSAIEVISNACICCTGNKHLTQSIDMLMSTHSNLEYIFIETTGLANPIKLRETVVHASIKYNLDYMGTLCIVDAKHTMDRLNVDEQLTQIAYSDYILISKLDLVNETIFNSLKEYIGSINPLAKYDKIYMGQYSIDKIEKFLSPISNYTEPIIKNSKHLHSNIKSVSFTCEFMKPFSDSEDNLFETIKGIIENNKIFRSKGIIKFPYENELTIFHSVEKEFQIEDEKVNREVYNNNRSDIIFIGKDLNQQSIMSILEKFRIN